MERWNTHEGIAEEKAFVVLYAFHALRFPGMRLHHRRFRPAERENLPADVKYVPEEVLTRDGLEVVTKEEVIRTQFQRIFPKGTEVPSGHAYEYVLGVCEAARHDFHAEDDLIGPEGEPLSSEAILPEPEVVEAMVEDFVRHRRKHCLPLEELIVQLQDAA